VSRKAHRDAGGTTGGGTTEGQPRRTTDRILDALNPPQREAVLHEKGPLLVLAGAAAARPASSRTGSPTCSSADTPGVDPGITFTNKAADEMKIRTEHLCGIVSPGLDFPQLLRTPPEAAHPSPSSLRKLLHHLRRRGLALPRQGAFQGAWHRP